MRVKALAEPVDVEPPRSGEDASDCVACNTPDEAYVWVGERWRVRAMDRPTGLPMVLILECRSHLDLGDLPNLLAAELGVMTVRLERAVRSLDGVARVHVNRWGDGSAHLHLWFLARPYGRLQLRGTFLSLWDDILPVIPEAQWRQNLAHVAAWLAEFGGRPLAEPPHIDWQSPSTVGESRTADAAAAATAAAEAAAEAAAAADAAVTDDPPVAADATPVAAPAAAEQGRARATEEGTPNDLSDRAPEEGTPSEDPDTATNEGAPGEAGDNARTHDLSDRTGTDQPATEDGVALANAPTRDLSASMPSGVPGPKPGPAGAVTPSEAPTKPIRVPGVIAGPATQVRQPDGSPTTP
jgi:hypothetical protein